MIGFTEQIVPAASLAPGTRVQWWGDTFRVVESIGSFDDGTDHLNVAYKGGNGSARYAANGLVRVLNLAPVEAPQ